jgi:hypothetical protein
MVWRLMEGAALNKFDESGLLHSTETVVHYIEVMIDITHSVFPMRALQIQKRYMRRHMRKAPYMKIKDYMAHVKELNKIY